MTEIINITIAILAGIGTIVVIVSIFTCVENIYQDFTDCSNTKHKAVISEKELATLNKRVIELERSIKPEVTQTGGGG